MLYTSCPAKNLSHLKVGGLPDWSTRPELSRRKHLADLLALVGFSAAVVIVVGQLFGDEPMEPGALKAWATLALASFAGYWAIRLRPSELIAPPSPVRHPEIPTFESDSEPFFRRAGGSGVQSISPAPATSIKSALLRWTYDKSGSCLN